MPANQDPTPRESPPEKVTITADGRTVEGVFLHRSRYDFEIEIQPPFPPLHTGWHIPPWSRSPRDFTTDYGDASARDTLVDLYRLCRFLEENQGTVVTAFAQLQHRIKALGGPQAYDDETHKAKQRALRQQLRAGLLNAREHQRRMAEIRERHETYETLRRCLIEHFFQMSIPQAESVNLREQVLELLTSWLQRQGGNNA